MIISDPSTIYIKIMGQIPMCFVIGNTDGVQYFRYLHGKIPRLKFNIPLPGDYDANVPFEIVKISPIEIPFLALPVLPQADRNRWTDNPEIVFNPTLSNTIARNFTESGTIEVGPRFEQLISPMKIFIIDHELGHFFYSDEFNADLFALVNFVRKGYNVSTAYYTLEKYLNKSKLQVNRLKDMFDKINTIQNFKL